MGAKTDYWENKLADTLLRGQPLTVNGKTLAWTPSAPTYYIGLTTSLSTDSTPGAEVSGGSYARQPVDATLAKFSGTLSSAQTVASTGTDGTIENIDPITYTNMPACTLVGWGIYDAPTGGNLLWYAPLNNQPITIAGGATVAFQAGQLSVQEDN